MAHKTSHIVLNYSSAFLNTQIPLL